MNDDDDDDCAVSIMMMCRKYYDYVLKVMNENDLS